MNNYLIEYRFRGRAKIQIRQMIFKLDNKFHLGILGSKNPIPHITFAGPFKTNNEAKLVTDFTALCKSTPICAFKVNGFGYFKNTGVVYINIIPSRKLDEFRWNLAQKLMPYCKLSDFDYEREFKFHATLAMKLDPPDFTSVKNYIETQDPPKFKYSLIRATILKKGKILHEYDFLQRRLLTRHQLLDRKIFAKTMKLLNDYLNGHYDPDKAFVMKTTVSKAISFGIIARIKKVFNKFF